MGTTDGEGRLDCGNGAMGQLVSGAMRRRWGPTGSSLALAMSLVTVAVLRGSPQAQHVLDLTTKVPPETAAGRERWIRNGPGRSSPKTLCRRVSAQFGARDSGVQTAPRKWASPPQFEVRSLKFEVLLVVSSVPYLAGPHVQKRTLPADLPRQDRGRRRTRAPETCAVSLTVSVSAFRRPTCFKDCELSSTKCPILRARRRGTPEAFGVKPYSDEPFYVGFNIGGYELGLDPNMSGVTLGTSVATYWGVPDIAAAHDRLLRQGARARADHRRRRRDQGRDGDRSVRQSDRDHRESAFQGCRV